MIYGYIRVSTDKQTVENQRYEINWFSKRSKVKINKWVGETVSGTKETGERKLGELLGNLQKNDILICSELSRLGRSLFMIMDILNTCMKKEVQVWTVKENYKLGTDISSKVLAFAFGISAEIERQLISQRTKEAMSRLKAEGCYLGRPLGSKKRNPVLKGRLTEVKKLLRQGVPKTHIAKKLCVSRSTLIRTCSNLKWWRLEK
jgi:DNA invertase Pin-like site-specific DNA recombinase